MKKIVTLILGWVLACSLMWGQGIVEGIVFDVNQEPLPGVAVMVKGTRRAVETNEAGRFSIRAAKGETLVFSCLGMIETEIPVRSENVSVKMLTDHYALDDAVVIGYGSVKKSDLTGSVATVKASELKNGKIGMVSSALQGTAAGVQVTAGNLKPGADAGIVIRGIGSVNAGTGPLYVVDGVPAGGLQDISASDIASIEILKDASAAAIYGSRGSNGVVLITTKRGEEGKSRLSFHAMGGIQIMMNKQSMMNAQQYFDLVQTSGQAYTWTTEELRLLSRGESTDWQNAVSRMGKFQNYSMSFSGGTGKMTSYFGVDWYSQEGIIKNSSFDKLTFRSNLDYRLNDWVRAGSRFNIVYSDLSNINEDTTNYGSGYGTMFSAISSQPTAPIYASDGSYFDGFLNTKANPVAMVELLDRHTKKTLTLGSFFLELEPVANLVLKTDNTARFVSYRVDEYEDGRMGQHYPANGAASVMANLQRFYQTENTVTYQMEGGDHKASLMGGFSASYTDFEEATATAKGLNAITRYNNLNGAETFGPDRSYASASTLASFFARATYGWKDRYLMTATMRADGSSKFAPGHKWGYFPSIAFAWKVSEEPFMKGTPFNHLKLRLSLGRLGNQNIGEYAFSALVDQGGSYQNYPFGQQVATGAVYSSISNPELTWEKANQADIGLDFGLFGNRISGTVEGYYKRTSDLLWTVPLPKESGYFSSLTNIGKLDNKGIEFSLNTINVNARNFQWTSNFNFTYNRNEVVELYDGKQDVGKWIFVGHSLNEFYVLQADGIWQLEDATEAARYGCEPGDRRIAEVKEDGVINGVDRTFAGQSTPTMYGGFTNTFTIGNARTGNFDLTVFMNYAAGHKIWNGLLTYENAYNRWGNMSTDYYNNYWKVDRPSNKYPAPRIGSAYANGDGTDAVLQKGDYLRIKNVELGYTLPYRLAEKLRMSSMRVYVSVQNLATLTAYTGYDVEAWDQVNTYPGARAFIGGISVNF